MNCCYLVCFTHASKGGQDYGSRTINLPEPITGQAGIDRLHEALARHLKVKAMAVLSLTRLDAPDAGALGDVAADLSALAVRIVGGGQCMTPDADELNLLVGRLTKLAGGAR